MTALKFTWGTTPAGRRRHLRVDNLDDYAREIDNLIGPWSTYARSRKPSMPCRSTLNATGPDARADATCRVCDATRKHLVEWRLECRYEWAEKQLEDDIERMILARTNRAPF